MHHLCCPIARPLTTAMLLGSVALAGVSPGACLAQGTDAGISSGKASSIEDGERSATPAPTQEKGAAQATVDPIRARIKYLHDRLRITPAQEPLWATVAQVMRDNTTAVAPLLRERLQSAEKGNAVDTLGAYEKLGEAQLDGLKKFTTAFEALYAGLSNDQKKIADAVFRLGPLSMVGGIPESAEQLVAPEPYRYYPSYAMVPALPPAPAYPPYAYSPPYAYYPYYNPWLWGPPVGLSASFFFAQGLHHRHGFFPGPVGRPGVPPARAGVIQHR
ncbi:MAG: Spy/CpxP family protein refolding chaperone [Stellaceae bacterium]